VEAAVDLDHGQAHDWGADRLRHGFMMARNFDTPSSPQDRPFG